MKNVFIITVILLLSCKHISLEKTNTKAEDAVEVLEAAEEIVDVITEINPEEGDVNQSYINSTLYKGTLNGNIKIELYLKESENPCGGDLTFFIGMYKYNTQDKWILLDITTDKHNKNYCMVEYSFSGVLFLEDNEGSLYGNWISADTKKQFKVELENQFLDIKYAKDHTVIEKLDEILFDDLIYGKNDC